MIIKLACLSLLLSTTVAIFAQQVQNFSLTNVTNGKVVSLDIYPSCAGVAIVFTTNACAYDDYYRSRINKLSRDYQDKVPVLLVNSSPDAVENAENDTKSTQLNLAIPYLALNPKYESQCNKEPIRILT